jgi:5,10-methylenetetrahydrofolate reductase
VALHPAPLEKEEVALPHPDRCGRGFHLVVNTERAEPQGRIVKVPPQVLRGYTAAGADGHERNHRPWLRLDSRLPVHQPHLELVIDEPDARLSPEEDQNRKVRQGMVGTASPEPCHVDRGTTAADRPGYRLLQIGAVPVVVLQEAVRPEPRPSLARHRIEIADNHVRLDACRQRLVGRAVGSDYHVGRLRQLAEELRRRKLPIGQYQGSHVPSIARCSLRGGPQFLRCGGYHRSHERPLVRGQVLEVQVQAHGPIGTRRCAHDRATQVGRVPEELEGEVDAFPWGRRSLGSDRYRAASLRDVERPGGHRAAFAYDLGRASDRKARAPPSVEPNPRCAPVEDPTGSRGFGDGGPAGVAPRSWSEHEGDRLLGPAVERRRFDRQPWRVVFEHARHRLGGGVGKHEQDSRPGRQSDSLAHALILGTGTRALDGCGTWTPAASGGTLNHVPFAVDLQTGAFPVSLEITPPKRMLRGILLRRARLLGECVRTINVIQRPDRLPSLDASIELLRHGFEPVWHLVTRGREEEDIRADIERAAAAGVRHALCLLGDHAVEREPARPLRIRETIALMRQLAPEITVGATLNQYAPSSDAVLRNLLPKVEAGAAYVQTQPVVELEAFLRLAERVRREVPDLRIVPMVMPIVAPETAQRVGARLGFSASESILSRLAAGDGWRLFQDTVAQLRESGLADGVAVMTFEMDPAPEVGDRIREALVGAGALSC